jgi:hypothetical protein
MSDTSQAFYQMQPKLTNNFDSVSVSSKSNKKFFKKNKYFKTILYIFLILYAAAIAPKLPNWITVYFEYTITKILIVFLIGLLATNDAIAAIIATIGVTITYIFISENKINSYIKDIIKDDDDENEDKCSIKKEEFNKNIENFDVFNFKQSHNNNIEHFNQKDTSINHYEEHFDVLHNDNNYINHIEEHFQN